jgi:tRNA (adenine22-N1)-methyltransferase
MLSARLQKIYDLLIPAEDVWDLCCDHGYLGIVAHKSRSFSQVHFVDRASHLIEALRERWQAEDQIFFYPQAAEELVPVLSGNVVLAGVGGLTMLSILEKLQNRNRLRAKRIILAPQKDERRLQSEVLRHFPSYRLDQSFMVREGARVREIFVLDLMNDLGMD